MATGAILGAAMAGPAVAQQPAAAPPTLSSTRVFELGASARVYYDTNIARGSAATAAQRGLVREDTVYQPAVTANILQPLGTQMVFLNGTAGYDFHERNTKLDRGNVSVTTGYAARIGFCQPTLLGSYSGRQSDLEDADNVTVDNLLESTTLTAILSCGRPIGPGIQVVASKNQTKNSADIRSETDHDGETLSATLNYTHPTLGQAAVIWNYAANEYPNRITPGRPVGDGFFTVLYGVQYQREFGQRLTVAATYGRTLAKREFAVAGEPLKFRTTTYTANADYRFGERLGLYVSGARSVKPSNRPGKLYDVSTVVEASADYALGTRYTIGVGRTRADNKSNGDTAVGTRPVVTKSRNDLSFARFNFAQSDRIKWELSVQHDDRKTNLPQFNYRSTRVGLSTSLKF